jgi:hypothetical protein
MDVFVIPLTPVRAGAESPVEFYSEPAVEPVVAPAVPVDEKTGGFFLVRFVRWVRRVPSRLVQGFSQALADGEAEQRRQEAGHAPSQEGSRLSRFVKRKLASAVAEQRLLWNLRHASAARLVHPETIPSARAIELATTEFRKDFEKHRLWFGIDTAIVVVSGLLAVVPGPNILAYYFIFLSVGHLFSMRGARKGRDASFWTAVPSAPLSDLHAALSLPTVERDASIDIVASTLGLDRLTAFVRRTAGA